MLSSIPQRVTEQPSSFVVLQHHTAASSVSSMMKTLSGTIQVPRNSTEFGNIEQFHASLGPPTPSPSTITETSSVRKEDLKLHPTKDVCDHQPPPTTTAFSTGGGLTRSRTLHSLSGSSSTTSSNDSSFGLSQDHHTLTPSLPAHREGGESPTTITSLPSPDFTTFGMDVRRFTNESPEVPSFNTALRQVMEPHLRKARLMREQARRRITQNLNVHDSIASSVGVPYVRLRSERPFLYDTYTHPMHEVLSEVLGVPDISRLHEQPSGDLDQLMAPLKSRKGRRKFQESYDNFVTSFCIPLLHSLAMSKNLFHEGNGDTRISYRYQAFPNIRVVRPGDASSGPQCDTALGHSIGFLRFHVPLTPSYGTNALYTESHPGKEDWHPLQTKSVGLGFLFDGGRCINFNLENTTDSTLVALDFVVAIYSAYEEEDDEQYPLVDADGLCNRKALEDQYSVGGPGFYDEAVIDIHPGSPLWQVVAKKHGRTNKLLDPDLSSGFPFVR